MTVSAKSARLGGTHRDLTAVVVSIPPSSIYGISGRTMFPLFGPINEDDIDRAVDAVDGVTAVYIREDIEKALQYSNRGSCQVYTFSEESFWPDHWRR